MNLLLYLILLQENYKKKMISGYETDRENHPLFDEAAWYVIVGGVTKGRIYGAPGMPKIHGQYECFITILYDGVNTFKFINSGNERTNKEKRWSYFITTAGFDFY